MNWSVGLLTSASVLMRLTVVHGADLGPQCRALEGRAGYDGANPIPDLKAGTIIGNGPSFFLQLFDINCMATSTHCRESNQPYLVAGDAVVITDLAPGYLCVAYAKPTQTVTSGWMPLDRVRIQKTITSQGPLAPWLGTWRDGSTTIKFSVRRKKLLVYGDAVWQGLAYPHFGELNDAGIPIANALHIGHEDGCEVKMLVLNDILAVRDNMGCGGTNVSFSGLYKHISK